MFISKKKLAAVFMVLLGAINVYADVHPQNGVSLGIDAGRAQAHTYCDSLIECDNTDTSLRVDVGYQFNTKWSAEFGYTSFTTLFNSHNDNFNASQQASAWTLSGLATAPLGDSFDLFGRAGIARYQMNNRATALGVPVAERTDVKPYFGTGFNFDLTERLVLRAEYQYYMDIPAADGGKDDLQALYGGVVYHF
jgi:opacity protein-like surface antigen